jgi:hypothetical protein
MWVSSNKLMSSEEYYASELSDDYLDAQADAGDYFLDESGFYLRLNSVKFPNLFRKVSFVSMRETTGERLSAVGLGRAFKQSNAVRIVLSWPRLRGFEMLR